jgi:hypothetical protein
MTDKACSLINTTTTRPLLDKAQAHKVALSPSLSLSLYHLMTLLGTLTVAGVAPFEGHLSCSGGDCGCSAVGGLQNGGQRSADHCVQESVCMMA